MTAWRKNEWFPTARAAVVDGYVVVRDLFHSKGYRTENGSLQTNDMKELVQGFWQGGPPPKFAVNQQEQETVGLFNENAKKFAQGMSLSPQYSRTGLRNYRHACLFGDQTTQMMAVNGKMLYVIANNGSYPYGKPERNVRGSRRGSAAQSLSSQSTLYALDLEAEGYGYWQWSVGREEGETKPTDFRFVGSPVFHGDLVIVPVRARRSLWLYALHPKRPAPGQPWPVEVVYKTRLCEDPSAVNGWASVGTCLVGSELYVNSGRGVLFAVDAGSGAVRWATRYRRTVNGRNSQTPYVQVANHSVTGWDENYVFVYGPYVVILPSDRKFFLGVNRRDGAFRFRMDEERFSDELNPMLDITYLIGVRDGRMYVGGPNRISCFSLDGEGSTSWTTNFDRVGVPDGRSRGKALLTGDAIYVPFEDSIIRIKEVKVKDDKGRLVEQQQLDSVIVEGLGNNPVGNLYTDGQRFLAVGGERLFSIVSAERRMMRLDDRVEKGELAARMERARLRASLKQSAEAMDDIVAVVDQLRREKTPAIELEAILLRELAETGLAEQQPVRTLQLIAGSDSRPAVLFRNPKSVGGLSADQAEQLRRIVIGALNALTEKPTPAAAELVLRGAELYDTSEKLNAAIATLSANADGLSLELFQREIKKTDERRRLLVLRSCGARFAEKAADELAEVAGNSSPPVKLAAARALAEIADRRCLAPLVELLGAEKVETRVNSFRILAGLTVSTFRVCRLWVEQRR